jgi:succinate-semialdehyde dehydrogenase/glutarate-semialdehyde dehydrogenase
MAIVTPIQTSAGERRRLALANPATLEPVGEIEVQTADDVREAVRRAREAQPEWASLGFEGRARYMRRALEVLLERQDEFMDVVMRESGKTRTEALMFTIFASCDSLQYYAKNTGRILRPKRVRLHGMMRLMKRLRIVYRPLGVVGIITPWNGPFILALNPTVQALMAGNAVILKPSEVTPYSSKLVGDLFEAAGLPEGVLSVVLGDGETGAALLEADVDKISFTGSVSTGRKVAEACARRLLPCTLELGGKDPMIVCSDANVDHAAGGAVTGAFLNSGHVCHSTERVYVLEDIAEEFTTKVVDRVSKLRQGHDGEFDLGAIFWPRQLEIIERHVEDAVAKGAKVLIGGRRNPNLKGLFYEPTVLTDVTHDMLVMTEETFGPILPIMRVRDEEEAIRLANDTRYGLSGTVWTRDTKKGARIGERIQAGNICVNDMTVTYGNQEAPFGGLKESGLGQVNGETGLRGYSHALPILIDRFGGRQTASQYPYSEKRDAGMQGFIRFLFGTRIGRWLS